MQGRFMGQVATRRPFDAARTEEPIGSGATARSLGVFAAYAGAVAGGALLLEAAWSWFVAGGQSAPADSAAYQDAQAASFAGAPMLGFALTLAAGRRLPGRRRDLSWTVYVLAVAEFGVIAVATVGWTILGLTVNAPDSTVPVAAREATLFVGSFGVAFGVALLMLAAAILDRD